MNLTHPATVYTADTILGDVIAGDKASGFLNQTTEGYESAGLPHAVLPPQVSKPLGQHIVVELEQADPTLLADVAYVEKHLIEAARVAGVTIMTRHFATVPTHSGRVGVSGALILAESHFTIHTDPQNGYAALDLFTCGGHTDPRRAFDLLIKAFKPQTVRYHEYQRGFLDTCGQKMFHGPAVLRSASVTYAAQAG